MTMWRRNSGGSREGGVVRLQPPPYFSKKSSHQCVRYDRCSCLIIHVGQTPNKKDLFSSAQLRDQHIVYNPNRGGQA